MPITRSTPQRNPEKILAWILFLGRSQRPGISSWMWRWIWRSSRFSSVIIFTPCQGINIPRRVWQAKSYPGRCESLNSLPEVLAFFLRFHNRNWLPYIPQILGNPAWSAKGFFPPFSSVASILPSELTFRLFQVTFLKTSPIRNYFSTWSSIKVWNG